MRSTLMAFAASVRSQGSSGHHDRVSYALDLDFDTGGDMRGLTASLASRHGPSGRDLFAQTFRYGEGTSNDRDSLNLRLGHGFSAWPGLLASCIEGEFGPGRLSSILFGLNYKRSEGGIKFGHPPPRLRHYAR